MTLFDSLEGVIEAVKEAVLCLLFTLVTDAKNIFSLAQLKQVILPLLIVSFKGRHEKKKSKLSNNHDPADAFDPPER